MRIDRKISIDVSDEIRRLVPVLGKEKASRLETAYLLGDDESRKRILEMIDTLKAAVFSDEDLKNAVLIEPPSQELVSNGDLNFGTVLYGKKRLYPLMLDRESLLTHVGIFGSSGYGKTNLVYWLVKTLADQDIPVLIFDFSKRNYRDLLAIPELKDKIRIYTVGRNIAPFRFNPLKPPEGVQISQWAKEFSEIFDHAYWMLGGGRHVILKALDAIYEARSPEFPRIKDLKDWLDKYRRSQTSSRERNWIATAERPLESLCFRELGDVFDCEEGVMPSEFLKKGRITILELDSLSTNDKTFFIEIMLQWIRDACLVSGQREKLMGVIALEEAHHVLNREKAKRIGMETVMDLIFREIRELGLGVVYVDQHPSLVSYPALGNTSTHIYMNLGLDTKYSSDILDASNMLGLKYEEEGDYLRRLPVGHAFILMRRLAFPNPFLVSFPLVDIKKGSVTDGMIKKFMEDKLLETIKKQRELKIEEPVEERPEIDLTQSIEELDDKSLKIIEIIGNNQGSSTSEIYNSMGISGQSFKKRAERLSEMGLIDSVTGKVYRQKAIYYFLTAQGEKLFESKFQRQVEKPEINIEDVMNFLISHFGLKGWRPLDKKTDQITLEKEGSKICVNVETEFNKEKVDGEINKLVKEGNLHFVCFSERIKNFVIQRAAKYCFDQKLGNVTIFVATINELKEGKDFKRIEFQV
jgi:DNA helicase HerA-like ATPase/DNA-binding MarR family transcriptional regulator